MSRSATDRQISFCKGIRDTLGLDVSDLSIDTYTFDEARDFISSHIDAFNEKKSRPKRMRWGVDPDFDDPSKPDDDDIWMADAFGIDLATGGLADD